jgi:hypothetical protein
LKALLLENEKGILNPNTRRQQDLIAHLNHAKGVHIISPKGWISSSRRKMHAGA